MKVCEIRLVNYKFMCDIFSRLFDLLFITLKLLLLLYIRTIT